MDPLLTFGLVQTVGSFISGLTQRSPKYQMTVEERFFANRVKLFTDMRKKREALASALSLASGIPVDEIKKKHGFGGNEFLTSAEMKRKLAELNTSYMQSGGPNLSDFTKTEPKNANEAVNRDMQIARAQSQGIKAQPDNKFIGQAERVFAGGSAESTPGKKNWYEGQTQLDASAFSKLPDSEKEKWVPDPANPDLYKKEEDDQ